MSIDLRGIATCSEVQPMFRALFIGLGKGLYSPLLGSWESRILWTCLGQCDRGVGCFKRGCAMDHSVSLSFLGAICDAQTGALRPIWVLELRQHGSWLIQNRCKHSRNDACIVYKDTPWGVTCCYCMIYPNFIDTVISTSPHTHTACLLMFLKSTW